MIPSILTDIREKDGEISLHKVKGYAETPPLLGERLILTTEEGTVIKTGVIELIEWLGNVSGNGSYYFNGKRRIVGSDCMFYTSGSAYRWRKVTSDDGKK